MRLRFIERIILAVALIGIPTPVIAQTRCVPPQDHVLVNRSMLRYDGATDLLQLLRRQGNQHRLAFTAQAPDDQPFLMLDGVGLGGGVQRLADIPPDHIISVTILRPVDAVSRFGPKAHKGAILITTKSGPGLSCNRPPTDPQ